jgi:hypothetical protein
MIARARSSPKRFAATACRHITAPNARRVLGQRELEAARISTAPLLREQHRPRRIG